MRRVYGRSVAELFSKQGIRIHPQIGEILTTPTQSQFMDYRGTWTPSNILEAIKVASSLAGRSKVKLAKGIAEKTPRVANDTPANTLIDIMNATVTREISPMGVHINTTKGCDNAACPAAEGRFLDTTIDLDLVSAGEAPYSSAQIFYEDERPIIVHKSRGEGTGLTLEEISINNIPYPPGSILALEPSRPKFFSKYDKAITVARPITDINAMSFIRLSAFALRPEERTPSFRLDGISEKYYEEFTTTTIEDIGGVVSRALVQVRGSDYQSSFTVGESRQ